MGLRKSGNLEKPQSTTSIKQIKRKRKIKTKPSSTPQENTDDSLQYFNEKPILITYQAVPIS
jgi:hypothetical protein